MVSLAATLLSFWRLPRRRRRCITLSGAAAVSGRHLTLIFGVYALSLLAALLTVGSLSDYLGRKPVIFTAVVLNSRGDAVIHLRR